MVTKKRVPIDVEGLRAELKKVCMTLGVTQETLSDALMGNKKTLSAALSRKVLNEDVLKKLELLYGIEADKYIIREEPKPEPQIETVPAAPQGNTEIAGLLRIVIEKMNDLTLEIRALKQATKVASESVAGDLVDIRSDLEKRPYPLDSTVLKQILKAIADDNDISGDVLRGIKYAQDDLKNAIAYGIGKADRMREEKGTKK